MSAPSAGKRRIDADVLKLIQGKHDVTVLGGLNAFSVKFYGPKETAYEGGVWKVRVDLPDEYPFKHPMITFVNKVFHPNVSLHTGYVCLDVIKQNWTALYDLSHIFELFLPQLLTYPNSAVPFNKEAGSLYLQSPEEFKIKVAEYIAKYATEEVLNTQEKNSSDSELSVSDFSDNEAEDVES